MARKAPSATAASIPARTMAIRTTGDLGARCDPAVSGNRSNIMIVFPRFCCFWAAAVAAPVLAGEDAAGTGTDRLQETIPRMITQGSARRARNA